jgi:molybdopterin converting factor small subunit
VGDVFDDLAGQYAAFAKLRNTCAIALNQKICSPDTPLQENCTLAFLPPVSGG